MPLSAQQPSDVPLTGEDARRAIRSGQWTGPTSGLAPGYVQGNLAILPAALAAVINPATGFAATFATVAAGVTVPATVEVARAVSTTVFV